MACPSCDHTMEALPASSQADETTTFYCPRCGTVKIDANLDGPSTIYVPKLVEQCRVFLDENLAQEGDKPKQVAELLGHLHRIGILESIDIPKDRPQL